MGLPAEIFLPDPPNPVKRAMIESFGGTVHAVGHDLDAAKDEAIAYAASIGGIGTLIGTPPNAMLAGFMSEIYGVRIGFAQWLLVGLPLVVLMLVPCWFLLTRVPWPGI